MLNDFTSLMNRFGGGLPTSITFDQDYRYPCHPRAGSMEQPPATAIDDRPTDPAVLAEVRDLVEQFTAAHTKRVGASPILAAGLSEAEILDAERRMGLRLPEDVRAFYRVTAGQEQDRYDVRIFGWFLAFPLSQVVEWYLEDGIGAYGWNDDHFENTPTVFETSPYAHVRRVSRSDWWVVLGPDTGMNYLTLDLDPGPDGASGQLIMFGRDVQDAVVYVAPSLRQLMRDTLASMRTGADYPEYPTGDAHRAVIDLRSEPLPVSPAVQDIHLLGAERFRLTDLAGMPRLRAIGIRDVRCEATHVDLAIPDRLPVEQVDVTAEAFDPALLAGTPTLRYLRLAGNTTPVSIAALAALPGLLRVDLSEAVIADIPALATFPALRVLDLNADQWRELLATGWTPDRLASARIGGPDAFQAAGEWRAAMGAHG